MRLTMAWVVTTGFVALNLMTGMPGVALMVAALGYGGMMAAVAVDVYLSVRK